MTNYHWQCRSRPPRLPHAHGHIPPHDYHTQCKGPLQALAEQLQLQLYLSNILIMTLGCSY